MPRYAWDDGFADPLCDARARSCGAAVSTADAPPAVVSAREVVGRCRSPPGPCRSPLLGDSSERLWYPASPGTQGRSLLLGDLAERPCGLGGALSSHDYVLPAPSLTPTTPATSPSPTSPLPQWRPAAEGPPASLHQSPQRRSSSASLTSAVVASTADLVSELRHGTKGLLVELEQRDSEVRVLRQALIDLTHDSVSLKPATQQLLSPLQGEAKELDFHQQAQLQSLKKSVREKQLRNRERRSTSAHGPGSSEAVASELRAELNEALVKLSEGSTRDKKLREDMAQLRRIAAHNHSRRRSAELDLERCRMGVEDSLSRRFQQAQMPSAATGMRSMRSSSPLGFIPLSRSPPRTPPMPSRLSTCSSICADASPMPSRLSTCSSMCTGASPSPTVCTRSPSRDPMQRAENLLVQMFEPPGARSPGASSRSPITRRHSGLSRSPRSPFRASEQSPFRGCSEPGATAAALSAFALPAESQFPPKVPTAASGYDVTVNTYTEPSPPPRAPPTPPTPSLPKAHSEPSTKSCAVSPASPQKLRSINGTIPRFPSAELGSPKPTWRGEKQDGATRRRSCPQLAAAASSPVGSRRDLQPPGNRLARSALAPSRAGTAVATTMEPVAQIGAVDSPVREAGWEQAPHQGADDTTSEATMDPSESTMDPSEAAKTWLDLLALRGTPEPAARFAAVEPAADNMGWEEATQQQGPAVVAVDIVTQWHPASLGQSSPEISFKDVFSIMQHGQSTPSTVDLATQCQQASMERLSSEDLSVTQLTLPMLSMQAVFGEARSEPTPSQSSPCPSDPVHLTSMPTTNTESVVEVARPVEIVAAEMRPSALMAAVSSELIAYGFDDVPLETSSIFCLESDRGLGPILRRRDEPTPVSPALLRDDHLALVARTVAARMSGCPETPWPSSSTTTAAAPTGFRGSYNNNSSTPCSNSSSFTTTSEVSAAGVAPTTTTTTAAPAELRLEVTERAPPRRMVTAPTMAPEAIREQPECPRAASPIPVHSGLQSSLTAAAPAELRLEVTEHGFLRRVAAPTVAAEALREQPEGPRAVSPIPVHSGLQSSLAAWRKKQLLPSTSSFLSASSDGKSTPGLSTVVSSPSSVVSSPPVAGEWKSRALIVDLPAPRLSKMPFRSSPDAPSARFRRLSSNGGNVYVGEPSAAISAPLA